MLVEDRDFCIPLAFDAPKRTGIHSSIAIPFGMEKLEWCGYPAVKKIEGMPMPRRLDRIPACDRRTDRQTDMRGKILLYVRLDYYSCVRSAVTLATIRPHSLPVIVA